MSSQFSFAIFMQLSTSLTTESIFLETITGTFDIGPS